MPPPIIPIAESDPALHALAVTTSNTQNLLGQGGVIVTPTRGLYVGGAGDVKVDMEGGETGVVFSSVPAGSILPVRVLRVWATGTTATSIVALW